MGPFDGAKEMKEETGMTVKFVALLTVFQGVETVIFPVVAPTGTVTTMVVELSTLTVNAGVPLNATVVAGEKLVPVSVTTCRQGALEGVKLVSVGAGGANGDDKAQRNPILHILVSGKVYP